MSEPEVRFVPAATIREWFNEMGLAERARTGEVSTFVLEDAPGPRHQPPGARSQLISYWEGGQEVAIVHQYTFPDGTIGASGQPDPKQLLRDGVLYVVTSG